MLRPQNILLDDSYNVKIFDFCLARLLMSDQSRCTTDIRGTRGYVAPEWLKRMAITAKVDVYSFEIMLLEIICCRKIFEQESWDEKIEILSDLAYDCYVEIKLHLLVENDEQAMLKRLVMTAILERLVMTSIWCIQEDPSLRPSMKKDKFSVSDDQDNDVNYLNILHTYDEGVRIMRCNVMKEDSLVDIIAQEGKGLQEVLRELGINRNKRVNNKSLKVQKAQAKRQMVGSSFSATPHVIATLTDYSYRCSYKAISLKLLTMTYGETKNNLKKRKLVDNPPLSSKVCPSEVIAIESTAALKIQEPVDLKDVVIGFNELATNAGTDLKMEVWKKAILEKNKEHYASAYTCVPPSSSIEQLSEVDRLENPALKETLISDLHMLNF
ncbi:hypothetical protein GIB67_038095 [Kingdonia uniflora]|uniref:Protein kinase domain-containing protein n=1 Tax=Kingdonia uniflora TaxID=39325 RepID=A0A7J7P7V2_9MAGN|nr:hypothetical protein GIB67_038095 [Kingdonia uniflora]